MSREREGAILSLIFVEKFLGFMLLILGVVLAHQSVIYVDSLGTFGLIFVATGVIMVLLGLLMLIAKTE
ncbi:hypothetical protein KEJ14_03275 [Candidatus Bathyarchaeota archaeon]|nr:hypothetical protein [Candidatus Bathyarchaeota archaeon]